MSRTLRATALAAVLAVVALALGVPSPAAARQATERSSNVLEAKVLGKSVRGKPITAWHLDSRPIGRRKGPTVVLIATMHGNEGAPRQILRTCLLYTSDAADE